MATHLPEPRSSAERRTDTLARLDHDVDCWVASTGAGSGPGIPYLIVLSFLYRDQELWLSTSAGAPTIRNLRDNPRVRIGIGLTRDVVLIEGTARLVEPDALPTGIGDAFAAHAGFDPRSIRSPYVYVAVTPVLIQAWREENELAGRDLMRNGRWLVDAE